MTTPELWLTSRAITVEAVALASYCWTPSNGDGECVDGGQYPPERLFWPVLALGVATSDTVRFEFAPTTLEACIGRARETSAEQTCVSIPHPSELVTLPFPEPAPGEWDVFLRGEWPEGTVSFAARLHRDEG